MRGRKLKMKRLFIILCCGILGCSTAPNQLSPSAQRVITQAEQANMTLHLYTTQKFVISAYERLPETTPSTIHVYIEGDGNSWKTRYKLSDNPTPRQPLALELASHDPHSHVIYLGRPCQYTPHTLDTACHSKYWSSHRYAPEVIESMDEILTALKKKTHATHFVLIGFSGGASVATLLASKRQDISSLITVAGDLNHETLNQYHRTSPLIGSLNPTEVASSLKYLTQHHWNGSKDRVVPVWIAEQFAKEIDNPACVHIHTLKGVSHHKGWVAHWDEILKESLLR